MAMNPIHRIRRRPRSCWGVGAILMLAAQSAMAAFFGGPVDAANMFGSALQSGEIASALNLLAPNVLVYDGGREDRSRDAYVAGPLKRDVAHFGTFYAETLSQNSTERGDIAWVTTRTRYLSKAADNPETFIGTETLVLHRLSGGWQIVHVHRSASAEAPPQ